MKEFNKKSEEFQSQKLLFLPILMVSRRTFDMLCKVQAAKGIPLGIWAESELIKAIHREWDFEENRPRRGRNHE